MILESLLASVVAPAVIDLVKNTAGALSRKWAGLSVDDQIKLQNADVIKLEALAKLDNPAGTPSQWVVDLRAAFRYVGAGVAIISGLFIVVTFPTAPVMVDAGLQLIAMPFGFIFGERLYLGLRGNQK